MRKKLPFYCFLGGILGIFSTVFNNIAFTVLSVSAITALGLLGQSVASVLVDSLGLFRVKRRPFEIKKLMGYALIVLGAIVMLVL